MKQKKQVKKVAKKDAKKKKGGAIRGVNQPNFSNVTGGVKSTEIIWEWDGSLWRQR